MRWQWHQCHSVFTVVVTAFILEVYTCCTAVRRCNPVYAWKLLWWKCELWAYYCINQHTSWELSHTWHAKIWSFAFCFNVGTYLQHGGVAYAQFSDITAPHVGYIQGGPKIGTFSKPYNTSSDIDQSWNLFTVRIRRKFVIVLSLKIPTHLKCVATLAWDNKHVFLVVIFLKCVVTVLQKSCFQLLL